MAELFFAASFHSTPLPHTTPPQTLSLTPPQIQMGKGAPKHKGRAGSGGSVGVSKKSKRGSNRGGGGKNANFAEVSVRQKNDSRLRQESKLRLLKVRALGRQIDKSAEILRNYITNKKKKIVKGYDPAMRGMELTGPARPAIGELFLNLLF